MEIHELVIEMKLLERRLTLYEEKYGILSEDLNHPGGMDFVFHRARRNILCPPELFGRLQDSLPW